MPGGVGDLNAAWCGTAPSPALTKGGRMGRGVFIAFLGCSLLAASMSCSPYEVPLPLGSIAEVNEDGGPPAEDGSTPVSAICTPTSEPVDVSAVHATAPSLVWSGDRWFVAYHARDAGTNDVRVAVLEQDGSVIA